MYMYAGRINDISPIATEREVPNQNVRLREMSGRRLTDQGHDRPFLLR